MLMESKIQIKILLIDSKESYEQYSYLEQFVSKERRKKIFKLKKETKKILSLFAELLLRTDLLQRKLEEQELIVIRRGACGKPMIEGKGVYHFSISHSENAVVFVSGNQELGIDCEKVRTIETSSFGRWLSKEEQKVLNESKDSLDAFFRIWTAKEAFVKMTGEGITEYFNKINICNIGIKGYLKTVRYKDYRITVCSKLCKKKEIEVREISKVDILNVWNDKGYD